MTHVPCFHIKLTFLTSLSKLENHGSAVSISCENMALPTKGMCVCERDVMNVYYKWSLVSRSLLTKRRARGTLGSTDTSSLRCGKYKDPLQLFHSTDFPVWSDDTQAELTWDWPSRWRAGRLGGRSAAQTRWGPAARASPAGRGRDQCARRKRRRWRSAVKEMIYGQSLFNNDARGS